MKITPEVQQHAQQVYDLLTFNPHLHAQGSWAATIDESAKYVVSEDPNICNTTMCVAGTSTFLREGAEGLDEYNSSKTCDTVLRRSVEALGFDNVAEAGQLFFCWEEEPALNMLAAIANGDEDKFKAVRKAYVDAHADVLDDEDDF